MILDVLKSTGVTATVGIGKKLYLCKMVMDIEAKHTEIDQGGVRIAELNEISYQRLLWLHRAFRLLGKDILRSWSNKVSLPWRYCKMFSGKTYRSMKIYYIICLATLDRTNRLEVIKYDEGI